MYKQFLIISISLLLASMLTAQRLDLTNPKKIEISDATLLVCFPSKTTINGKVGYYYEPTNLRVSERDAVQELSLLEYDLDKDGIADGGILHMLLTWGLTPPQIQEANQILSLITEQEASLFGAVPLLPSSTLSFSITQTELGQLLTQALAKGSGGQLAQLVPLTPNEKWASSFRFNAKEIQQLQALLKDDTQLKDTYFTFGFDFRGKAITIEKNLHTLFAPILTNNN